MTNIKPSDKDERDVATEKAAIAAELNALLKAGNGNATLNKRQAALYVQATPRYLERQI